jgi:hypothetical protein
MTEALDKFTEIADHMKHTDNVAKGSMFGAKCLKTNGKAFAMLHNEKMVFKISPLLYESMFVLEGVRNFEPMPGRKMNGWVEVPASHVESWEDLSFKAMNYVKSLNEQ